MDLLMCIVAVLVAGLNYANFRLFKDRTNTNAFWLGACFGAEIIIAVTFFCKYMGWATSLVG